MYHVNAVLDQRSFEPVHMFNLLMYKYFVDSAYVN